MSSSASLFCNQRIWQAICGHVDESPLSQLDMRPTSKPGRPARFSPVIKHLAWQSALFVMSIGRISFSKDRFRRRGNKNTPFAIGKLPFCLVCNTKEGGLACASQCDHSSASARSLHLAAATPTLDHSINSSLVHFCLRVRQFRCLFHSQRIS